MRRDDPVVAVFSTALPCPKEMKLPEDIVDEAQKQSAALSFSASPVAFVCEGPKQLGSLHPSLALQRCCRHVTVAGCRAGAGEEGASTPARVFIVEVVVTRVVMVPALVLA